ncbi:helix-turn-helix transcriptional regulator [Bacteroidia bacterium]|nr:helix-turn-helix transcriptional regulator [Bacteroidia bacterium]
MSASPKIVLMEPSAIVRCGLAALLKSIDGAHWQIIEVPEAAQIKTTPQCLHADVLIVNPATLGEMSLPQIKKNIDSETLKCIALQTNLIDHSTLQFYDEAIAIYDSAEQIKEKLLKIVHEPKHTARREVLSSREKEIIVCVVKGMVNHQIADHLCISTHTVIAHRRNIAAKLEIHSTAGLTIYAIVNKLVELSEIHSDQ